MAIKLLDPSRRFEVISQYDESIDGKSEAGNAAYEKYLDTLDPADLIKAEGKGEPTPFVVRCLTTEEQADIQLKHFAVDTENKKVLYKHGYNYFLLDAFNLACEGMKTADGVKKVTANEIGMQHAVSIGAALMKFTTLAKNTKNV